MTGILFSIFDNSLVTANSLTPLENNDSWLSKPNVIAGAFGSDNSRAVVNGDNIYLLLDNYQGVVFVKSDDGGKSFSTPVTLLSKWNSSSSTSPMPELAASHDNVCVVYTSGKDVFLLRSTDGGRTFSSPINVSKMGVEDSPSAVVYAPAISVTEDGKRVYVGWIVWQQMYFAQSADGGATFSTHASLSKEGETVIGEQIASTGRNVYLLWSGVDERNLYYLSFAKSNDWGHTFQSISNISANRPPYSSFEPELAVDASDENAIFLSWRDEVSINQGSRNLGAGVAFAKSTDSGKTFNITRYVGSGAWPALAVSGKNIYIASGVEKDGLVNIGFVGSLDGGKTFSKQIILSNHTWSLDPRDPRPLPAIAADGANVFVGWRYTASGNTEDNSNHETYLAASYDGGRTFTRQINVSASRAGDTLTPPTIQASPVGKVFVIWPEQGLSANDTGRVDLMLVNGQIPEQYTKQFRQVSSLTSVEAYDPTILVIAITILAIGVGAGSTFFLLRKRHTVK